MPNSNSRSAQNRPQHCTTSKAAYPWHSQQNQMPRRQPHHFVQCPKPPKAASPTNSHPNKCQDNQIDESLLERITAQKVEIIYFDPEQHFLQLGQGHRAQAHLPGSQEHPFLLLQPSQHLHVARSQHPPSQHDSPAILCSNASKR